MEIKDVSERLRKADCKITRQRIEIAKILGDNPGKHMSIEDLHAILLNAKSNIGLTTIYRTLALFEEVGLVEETDFGDGRIRYELKDNSFDQHHHHHLICLDCGMVVEFQDEVMDEREKKVAEQYQFTITEHQAKFMGYCKECQIARNK